MSDTAIGSAALLRRASDVFQERGIEGWVEEIWHPEVELDFRPAGVPGLGVYRGIEAAARATRDWASGFREWNVTVVEVVPIDETRAYSEWIQTGYGVGSGAPVDMRYAQIVEIRDGRAIRITIYTDLEQARRDAGLGP